MGARKARIPHDTADQALFNPACRSPLSRHLDIPPQPFTEFKRIPPIALLLRKRTFDGFPRQRYCQGPTGIHNPALSIAGPGQTGLSENPLGIVDTGLSAASHKALWNRGKP